MRTVLIGSDFMYGSDGNLKPIEINTAVGWNRRKLESDDESIDLTQLHTFVQQNSFTKIVYMGAIQPIDLKLSQYCATNSLVYEWIKVSSDSITIPNVEDNSTTLIIRSAYDTTAIVDDMYCRDKINYLNLIKNEIFSSQFAYMNENGILINNITTITDNGNHPNFILKSRFPGYDKSTYPKLYKVTTQQELDVILQNVTYGYFMMEFHYNPSKLYQNHIEVIRGLNLLFPPNLENISLGGYTSFCDNIVDESSLFDSLTFELSNSDRDKYLYLNTQLFEKPKLSDDDYVEMADGSFKTAVDLQVGDLIKTIDIPNPSSGDITDETINFHISYDELVTGTTYRTNVVISKSRVNSFANTTKLTFSDGSTWFDTESSSYLVYKNNEVRFCFLNGEIQTDQSTKLQIGDEVILINTIDNVTPQFIKKIVSNIEYEKTFFGGWIITVEDKHLFLTKTTQSGNDSYVTIEHNVQCSFASSCFSTPSCGKNFCCGVTANCVASCSNCNIA